MRAFSANLGFLWTELPLQDAIRAAADAGFRAVECHWPYDTPPDTVARALAETGLPMLSLNTRPGGPGEFGLAALKGREDEARAAIDEAIAYARATRTSAVHVMAGKDGDEETFRASLTHACNAAPDLTILIEALNPHDVPGYHLNSQEKAAQTCTALGSPNLKLMVDCYHVGRTEGDVLATYQRHRALIGHVQLAAVPDRGAPDHGTVDYAALLPKLDWPGPFGAEYRPNGPTDASLSWLPALSRC
ncbi:hydroxypyruvate isomerase family protein [Pararhodobacter marinus]|uniref:hydroxypyruvate isomerase family protein n=1 Tax=Pararhodobacter marinus TaxID=2184063 RepID=UPI00143E0E46|nr:TIM barrel protein [Pararhodobacter marinus]